MKVGIIDVSYALAPSGGVRIQGLMWKYGLEQIGHESILINFWEEHDWKSYDAIIVLGYGGFLRTISRDLRPYCKNLVLAPIIDPAWSVPVFKFFVKYWGCHHLLGLTSTYHDLYLAAKHYDVFLARSEFEAMYIEKCLDIPREKIKIVPLSIRTPMLDSMPEKEPFVLHVSRLAASNKNVPRLIQAAIKYGFQLKLGGWLNGKAEQDWLHKQINGHDNIEYIGMLSEEDLVSWYTRAKVFALPSLVEGVGMVALEAAGRGAEIVLTNDGAPKDYYKGRAYLVNPKSVEEIGNACIEALHRGNKQPDLLHFVRENYSLEACSKLLAKSIRK